MLQIVLKLAVIISLIVLFIQDIRQREVSFYFLLTSFLLVFVLGLTSNINIVDLGINALFIILQIAFLFAYLYFTGRDPMLLLKDFLGLGDILFWLVPALYFKPVEFVLYSLVCYLVIVLVYAIIFIFRKKSTTIPLAGFMALFMALYMVVSWQDGDLIINFVSKYISVQL